MGPAHELMLQVSPFGALSNRYQQNIQGVTSGLTGGPVSPTFHNGKPVAAAFDKKIDMNDNVPVLPASGYSTRLLP